MGILPAIWTVWLYTAVCVLLALACLVGAFMPILRWMKVMLGGCCVIAILALVGAYYTGFTFHLNTSAPVSGDRLVYLVPQCVCPPDSNFQTEIDAVRLRDGHIQWRHPEESMPLIGSFSFVSDDQRVYVLQPALDASHAGQHLVTALDAQSGRQVWQVAVGAASLAGVVNGQLILDGLILDGATGRELLRVPGRYFGVAGNGNAYACSNTGITATEEATGRLLWTFQGAWGCGLTLTPDVLIVNGYGVLTGIRIKDGSLLWQVSEGEPSTRPIVMDDTVFTSIPGEANPFDVTVARNEPVVHGTGVVKARRISDGTLVWQKTLGTYPLLYDGAENILLVGGDSALVALRGTDGAQLWTFPYAYGSPFVRNVVDGVVILGYSGSQQIVALDLHTGSMYWQTSL